MKDINKNIEINLPGSKSIAARALVCRLLSGHDTRMSNLPDCGDTRGMLRLTEAVRTLLSPSSSDCPSSPFIGEGGTTLRFGMAACASIPGLDITLRCAPRLLERPQEELIESLRNFGANIERVPDGFHIRGKMLSGGEFKMKGDVSSQFISALMLAAPMWEKDTVLLIKGPVVSVPYITMTAGVMRHFGAYAEVRESSSLRGGDVEVRIRATGYPQCAAYEVEGDWSAASYVYETLLIRESLHMGNPYVVMETLQAPAESLQGDSRIAEIYKSAFKSLGKDETLSLDLGDTPDLVPALAVGLCLAGIRFRFVNVAHLRHKETNRMDAIRTEIRRLGFVIETGDDFMAWSGGKCPPEENPLIRTYGDHRMAMAFAPASLLFPRIEIENPDVVEKSFPTYWQEIKKLLQ